MEGLKFSEEAEILKLKVRLKSIIDAIDNKDSLEYLKVFALLALEDSLNRVKGQ